MVMASLKTDLNTGTSALTLSENKCLDTWCFINSELVVGFPLETGHIKFLISTFDSR